MGKKDTKPDFVVTVASSGEGYVCVDSNEKYHVGDPVGYKSLKEYMILYLSTHCKGCLD